jgi:mannose-6-phosphate isomerase-like protein (cupin superfamily)
MAASLLIVSPWLVQWILLSGSGDIDCKSRSVGITRNLLSAIKTNGMHWLKVG